MTDFVTAVNARGEKQEIPREWLDHPVFGAAFKLPPSSREQQSDSPDETWNVKQLRAFADEHQIDLTGLSLKDDILAAVTQPAGQGDTGDDPTES